MPGVGDTPYVPWAEGGNGGTASQLRVLGDWDDELGRTGGWCRRGPMGRGGEKGKKGKKRKREKEGGTFWVPGELLLHTREDAEAHLWEALKEGDDWDDGDDKGDEGDDKGGGVTRGVRWGVQGR